MKFPAPVSLSWLAGFLGAELIGDPNALAHGINEIHGVETGDLVFVDHPKYYNPVLASAASFVIIDKVVDCPPGKALLVTPEPFEAYLKIVTHFRPFEKATGMISDSAQVAASAYLYPGVFIGNHVRIGERCRIFPGVVILDHCIIGNDVIIQSGTVIGSDAFYYNTKKNREIWYKKMLSCGRVVIEDFVEIGAGCTIDRGVTGDTRIGKGTKMDNQIHIGHDLVLGSNSLVAAQVGFAGGSVIGNGFTAWGQVGISKTLHIGDNTTILAQSGVGHNLEPGKAWFGSPAEEAIHKKRELIWIKRIPEIWKKLNA